MAENKIIVASTPFLRNGETAHCLMFDALLAAIACRAVRRVLIWRACACDHDYRDACGCRDRGSCSDTV